jgi:hypothetical protein
MEKGTGSAWGLPLVRDGKNRYSAQAASRALKAAGIRAGAEASGEDGGLFSGEELAKLGVGPLGRYTGGEPIKPLPLKPEHFFRAGTFPACSARNFFAGIEFENTAWHAGGDFPSLFRFHLEFLRTWGFSGGLAVPGEKTGGTFVPLADYLRFLHKEGRETGGKILAAMETDFFKKSLLPLLPEAEPFAAGDAGKIPLGNAEGGESLLAAGVSGAGLVLYETLPPNLKILKARCDILLAVETERADPSHLALLGEIDARLVLVILITDKGADYKSGLLKQTGISDISGADTEARLFRSLIPTSPGGKPPPLPFARTPPGKTSPSENDEAVPAWFSPGWVRAAALGSGELPGREEAAALGLLPQWEAGRTETAGGAVFAAVSRFAGIRVSDFRDEQALYYADSPGPEPKRPGTAPVFAAPPESGEAAFEKLDNKQRAFFLYWRDQCRRGNYILPELAAPDGNAESRRKAGLEYYIEVYARELILSMGHEGPMKGFLALRELFHEYDAPCPALGNILFRFLVDFAVIYGIAGQAFGLLFDSLPPLIERQEASGTAGKIDPALAMLLDFALFRFFIEEKRSPENGEGKIDEYLLPFIKVLLPKKARKNLAEKSAEEKFGGALVRLDRRLREDWNKSFFEFFCPPSPVRSDFRAFEKCPGAGSSAYTVYRFSFSGHRPLVSALEDLALNPGSTELPAGARPPSFSLETNLVGELRRESDEVREMLAKNGTPENPSPKTALVNAAKRLPPRSGSFPGEQTPRYAAPDSALMEKFILSLSGAEQNALALLLDGKDIGEAEADRINAAFNGRFGDLLVVYEDGRPSIPNEYLSILKTSWKFHEG